MSMTGKKRRAGRMLFQSCRKGRETVIKKCIGIAAVLAVIGLFIMIGGCSMEHMPENKTDDAANSVNGVIFVPVGDDLLMPIFY